MCLYILIWRSESNQLRSRSWELIWSQPSFMQVAFLHFLIYVFPVSILVTHMWTALTHISPCHKDLLFKKLAMISFQIRPNIPKKLMWFAPWQQGHGWSGVGCMNKGRKGAQASAFPSSCLWPYDPLVAWCLYMNFFLMCNCRIETWFRLHSC